MSSWTTLPGLDQVAAPPASDAGVTNPPGSASPTAGGSRSAAQRPYGGRHHVMNIAGKRILAEFADSHPTLNPTKDERSTLINEVQAAGNEYWNIIHFRMWLKRVKSKRLGESHTHASSLDAKQIERLNTLISAATPNPSNAVIAIWAEAVNANVDIVKDYLRDTRPPSPLAIRTDAIAGQSGLPSPVDDNRRHPFLTELYQRDEDRRAPQERLPTPANTATPTLSPALPYARLTPVSPRFAPSRTDWTEQWLTAASFHVKAKTEPSEPTVPTVQVLPTPPTTASLLPPPAPRVPPSPPSDALLTAILDGVDHYMASPSPPTDLPPPQNAAEFDARWAIFAPKLERLCQAFSIPSQSQ